jgi:hypothetical protein
MADRELVQQPQEVQDLLRERLALLDYSDQYRAQFETGQLEDYKNYRAYVQEADETDLAGNANEEGTKSTRSNIKIPLTYRIWDTWRAKVFETLTGGRPYIDMKPIISELMDPQAMTQREASAKLAAAVLDGDLEKNRYEWFLYQYLTALGVFKAAIAGVGWREEVRTVKKRKPVMIEELQPDPATGMPIMVQRESGQYELVDEDTPVWDNNEITLIDWWDFWPDARGENDPDSWRYCFHREWMTKREIEEYLTHLEELGGEVYKPDWDKIKPSLQHDTDKWTRQSEIDVAEPGEESSIPEHLQQYEVLHYWEDDVHAVILERAQTVYEGGNPYSHGKKPFIFRSFDPLPGEVYGDSGCEKIRHLQDEVDTSTNQRIDNAAFILNAMRWVDPDSDISDAELISRPHGVVHGVEGKDFGPVSTQPLSADAFMETQIIEKAAEDTMAVSQASSGGTEPGDPTATEITVRNTNAGTRYKLRIMLVIQDLKRLAYLMDMNNQQFMDKARLVQVYDEQGVASWAEADIGDILGEHDYVPAGSIEPDVNKEIKRGQFIQAVQVVSQSQPLAAIARWDAIGKELWKLFGYTNADRFQLTQQEIQMQQMQQMVMGLMQQLQQQQAEGEKMAFEREKEGNRAAEASRQMDQNEVGQLLQLLPQLIQAMGGQNGAVA